MILFRPSTTEEFFKIYSKSENADTAWKRTNVYRSETERFLAG